MRRRERTRDNSRGGSSYFLWVHVVLLLCSSTLILEASAGDLAEECLNPNRREAAVQFRGQVILVDEDNFPKHRAKYPPRTDTTLESGLEYFILHQDKPILYVKNFLNETSANQLQQICINNQRFTRSPIRGHGGDLSVAHSEIRTSESCTLVPASIYMANPQYQAMIQQEPMSPQLAQIVQEVSLSWDIAVQASSLLDADPNQVEALQLVRYTTPTAEYKLHHDHGAFYGKQTEHRPWTMLIFLNDVSDGGNTAFPKLELEVMPRQGDAVIWSNVDGNGDVDPDMVHMGKPPGKVGIEKYAVNVWFGAESFASRSNEWRQW